MLRYSLLLVSTALFSSSIFALSSFSELTTYPQFCMQAAYNEELFMNFKKAPVYTEVLEHVTYEHGKKYLEIVLHESPTFREKFDLFRVNDTQGNPVTYSYDAAGLFSPTTLRYMKVASDLKNQFGSLDTWNIIEIGGGYGGQCVILSKLFKFASYTIVDLPGPLALTEKYLKNLGITNVIFKTSDELIEDQKYDLVISNYAFSECNSSLQEEYLKKVLYKATTGYLTCNFIELREINILTKDALIQRLNNKNIICKELPEVPLTASNNYIIVWNSQPNSLVRF